MWVFLKQDPDPGSGFKILICRIKMDPAENGPDPQP